MKILIVDEIGFIRQSLNQKLSRHDITAVTAESGEEALSILNMDFAIDTVLTSLFLPTMNAIELYKSATKIERFNDEGMIPPLNFYLMVTREHGSSSPKMKELTRDALALGYRDLFIKPIDVELLVNKLRSAESNSSSDETDTETTTENHSDTENPDSSVEDSKMDDEKITMRIDEMSEVKKGLHALKKEVCDSIDSLLEKVSKKLDLAESKTD